MWSSLLWRESLSKMIDPTNKEMQNLIDVCQKHTAVGINYNIYLYLLNKHLIDIKMSNDETLCLLFGCPYRVFELKKENIKISNDKINNSYDLFKCNWSPEFPLEYFEKFESLILFA